MSNHDREEKPPTEKPRHTLKNGTYKIIKCRDIDKAIANRSQMFVHGGIFTND
jgi:hypothetical protein